MRTGVEDRLRPLVRAKLIELDNLHEKLHLPLEEAVEIICGGVEERTIPDRLQNHAIDLMIELEAESVQACTANGASYTYNMPVNQLANQFLPLLRTAFKVDGPE